MSIYLGVLWCEIFSTALERLIRKKTKRNLYKLTKIVICVVGVHVIFKSKFVCISYVICKHITSYGVQKHVIT